MVFRDLYQDDRHPVRVCEPHLDQPPRLAAGGLQNLGAEGLQPLVLSATSRTCNHSDTFGVAICPASPEISRKPPPRKNTTDGSSAVAELPVDGETQGVPVEPARAGQVRRGGAERGYRGPPRPEMMLRRRPSRHPPITPGSSPSIRHSWGSHRLGAFTAPERGGGRRGSSTVACRAAWKTRISAGAPPRDRRPAAPRPRPRAPRPGHLYGRQGREDAAGCAQLSLLGQRSPPWPRPHSVCRSGHWCRH